MSTVEENWHRTSAAAAKKKIMDLAWTNIDDREEVMTVLARRYYSGMARLQRKRQPRNA